MSYNINLGKWNSVFAVPKEIVDKNIKALSEVQLKVILWALCHGDENFEIEVVARCVGFSEEDVSMALQYWMREGVLCKREKPAPHVEAASQKNVPQRVTARYSRPDSRYMVNRMQSCADIDFLVKEAEVVLRRPLSAGDMSTLLMLRDNDGLPTDVILMLLQYAVSVGKCGMKYIAKAGSSWASQGIDNLEKAEKKIVELNCANTTWKKFESIAGIEHRAPTSCEEEAVLRWFNVWNYCDEMIKEAYDRCVNANGKYILKYMDSIIKRWHSQGVFTPEQALAENSSRKKKNFSSKSSVEPSYNIDEYEKYNIFDYIN